MIGWLRKWWMWIAGGVAALFVFVSARASGKRGERAKQLDRQADDAADQADAAQAEVDALLLRVDAATARRKEAEADAEQERKDRSNDDRDGGDRMDDALRD